MTKKGHSTRTTRRIVRGPATRYAHLRKRKRKGETMPAGREKKGR
jgi:hypothetical protein